VVDFEVEVEVVVESEAVVKDEIVRMVVVVLVGLLLLRVDHLSVHGLHLQLQVSSQSQVVQLPKNQLHALKL
jgi:hypothetical protein